MKLLLVMAISLILISVPSCGSSPEDSPPITVKLSFPDGAPPLNQEARLVCTVGTFVAFTDLSVDISLPDGFELVSGRLSTSLDYYKPVDYYRLSPQQANELDEFDVIDAVVRSVKVGNWTITCNAYLGPDTPAVLQDEESAIYVSVSEHSAEWRTTPP